MRTLRNNIGDTENKRLFIHLPPIVCLDRSSVLLQIRFNSSAYQNEQYKFEHGSAKVRVDFLSKDQIFEKAETPSRIFSSCRRVACSADGSRSTWPRIQGTDRSRGN